MDNRRSIPQNQRPTNPDNLGMPARRVSSTPPLSRPPAASTPEVPVQLAAPSQKDLADLRQDYGFDDIPVDSDDMENVRFRDIFKAWAKQGIKNSALEEKLKQAGTRKDRLNEIKNDLKWALQADLDEPGKPVIKQPQQQSQQDKPTTTPVPPAVSRVQPTHPAQDPTQPISDPSKTIDINISFGSLPKLPTEKAKQAAKSTLSKLRSLRPSKKMISPLAIIPVVVIAGTLAWKFVPGSPGAKASENASTEQERSKEAPKYATFLPEKKSIDALGGWHKVSPEGRDAVFAYADKIDGTPINVSQQPLPAGFKKDVNASVQDLAKAYGASNKITAGQTSAYIGTSVQGPQSVIMAKNDTLILIKSTKKISDDAWKSYIESLQ